LGKAALNKEKTVHQQTEGKFKEETSKGLHLEHNFFYDAENRRLRKLDQK
jgi:hypothetical protein